MSKVINLPSFYAFISTEGPYWMLLLNKLVGHWSAHLPADLAGVLTEGAYDLAAHGSAHLW